MCKVVAYMRISTKEERGKQKFTRQEQAIQAGDTILFKDVCRFTREHDNGYKRYMELLNKGIEMVFIDKPTLNTEYIKSM